MKIILLLSSIFICTLSFSQTPDPGLPGEYEVSSQEYDFGDETFVTPSFPDMIEVIGSVHYPSDLSDGPFPVLVFLHGRHSTCYNGGSTSITWPCTGSWSAIPSYQGYDYLAEQMASHGYIVISISANSISSTDNTTPDYGMRARGELVQHHLNLWKDWSTVGGDPFGDLFIGKLDLENVGTMGHSRGGEGVIEHALYNRELGSPFGINAVLTLAPVDFNRPVLNGIPIMNIAPYCDGDVADLQGVHFYDDARYLDDDDTMPKHNLMMLGANHNYYNTVWTPGEFPAGAADDWGYVDTWQTDEHCGSSAPENGRYTPEKQRNSLLAYASAFFRVYIGGENEFDPILKVTDVIPPASSTLDPEDIFMSYHPPTHKRVDVNKQIGEDAELTNDLMTDVEASGLVVYDICGDDFGEQYCIGEGASQEPHNKNGGVAVLGLSQLELEWNSADDYYQNNLPDFLSDFTQFDQLQFRAAVNFATSPTDTELNFNIVLTDNLDETASLPVGEYSHALFFPPGDYGTVLPRTMHNTISIPVEDFTGIDLENIKNIRFEFNESAEGGILISDLALSSNNPVLLPPIANFEANITTSCTGEISFTDLSTFNPTEWFWDFGDGNTSTEEDPIHIYETNGVFTVSLTVSNEAGSDDYIETAYIEIDRPLAPLAEGTSVCGEGEIILNATGAGGTINWYDSPGGTLLGTGATYEDYITETTNYYIQEEMPNELMSVGPPNRFFGSGGYFGANDLRGIFFDVYSPFILESVKVYANGSGIRKIQVLDGEGGTVVHSLDVDIPNGESVVTLNFPLEVHDGYYIKITGALVDLYRINDGSPDYPYEIPGIVALTGSNADPSTDFYYFFFDWKIRESNCLSPFTEVTATATPSFEIETSDDVTIIAGETTTLTATGGISYSWTPETGLSDPDAGTTDANPAVTTTYTVTALNEEGCASSAELTVTVEGNLNVKENNQVISLQPNPTTGILNIQTEGVHFPYTIEVLNLAGQLVYKHEKVTETIVQVNLDNLSDGLYYIKLYNSKFETIEKLIIR